TPSPSPTRRGEQNLTPSPSPTRRGEQDLTPSPSPTRRGEQNLTPSPSPTRRGEQGLTADPAPFGRGEHDLTPTISSKGRGGWVLPTLLLAVAFLFKQNAILFALPLWAQIFFASDKNLSARVFSLLAALAVFAFPVLIVSLPFLLYSNDYWYMNVQYVSDAPLQTQSWLVGVAGIFSADNLFLRASSGLTLLAAAAISFFGARRNVNLWLMALLIVLSFFLLSKKVVGYYYVMIFPFALVTLVPAKRFRLLTVIVAATAFIFVSPYFAAWANQAHWWLYAMLGVANSALWLGMLVWLWKGSERAREGGEGARGRERAERAEKELRELGFLSVALFFSAIAAALVQPLINSQSSPIRAPLVAPGSEFQVLFAFLVFAFLVLVSLVAAHFFSRPVAGTTRIRWGMYALVVLLAPLYFLTFALTKESTAAFELFLKTIGQ
ncbi:MAG: hypothetical protein HY741_27455, partial [Chloroflexi bacterium]|nr:hypothetical protein [Chloroflexota bacterium]